MVFDECHYTNDLHPYSELMNLFYEEKSFESYLIYNEPLGLTASLGIGKEGKSLENIAKFYANLNCKHLSILSDENLIQELNNKIPNKNCDFIIFEAMQFIQKSIKLEYPKQTNKLGHPDNEQFIVNKI
jgi:hypothetical protein